MNRREFIKYAQALGLSIPLQLNSAQASPSTHSKNSSVIIIGAGAAGLSAGYLLKQQGIDFIILEAASYHGGRMKRNSEFAEFPIPLGAEWIHVDPKILKTIVNDSRIPITTSTTLYDPEKDYGLYEGEEISIAEADFTEDSKFINSTWFDFFNDHIFPSIKNHIIYKSAVNSIDYTDDLIQVKTSQATYSCNKAIVTVPVKLLQKGMINFNPPLPTKKQNAINQVQVWDGCKAFIEFSEKFYPALVGFEITPSTAGQKLYYDAAYGQASKQNILGLFAVGTATNPYIHLSDKDLIAYMLEELDELFQGQASRYYIKHTFQNWNKEPYAQGAYVVDHENWRLMRTLGKSVDDRLFFAGDAYSDGEDWSSVHTAFYSAKRAVNKILNHVL